MRILINDKEVLFPSSLSEYTLGQRIAFHKEHGELLDKMLESILAMEDELKREVELVEFHFEKMCRTVAFFSGFSLEAIKETQYLEDVERYYRSSIAVLFEDEEREKSEPKLSFVWNGEEWELPEPEIKNGSKTKFGEFIDGKQTVNNMIDLGYGKWEAMLALCAIYLRKKGEPYKQEFLYEGSERMELMKQLPMNIATQVGFFLNRCLSFYINISLSSGNPELKEVAAM